MPTLRLNLLKIKVLGLTLWHSDKVIRGDDREHAMAGKRFVLVRKGTQKAPRDPEGPRQESIALSVVCRKLVSIPAVSLDATRTLRSTAAAAFRLYPS